MSDAFWLIGLILAPVFTGLACLIARGARACERINVMGALVTLGLSVAVVARIIKDGAFDSVRGLLYVDAFSGLMIASIGLVGFAGSMISIPFIRTENDRGAVPQRDRGVRLYYAGIHAFIATMYFTVSVDNLGLLWVGIEATTVASALLVGFSRKRAALDAAWKYLILCTVGITCALFGVLLTYFAARIGSGNGSLDWSSLAGPTGTLDPDLMRLAFVFILVGLGTKAGFAPLHTWMADAYGQAPSPVAGMLSGVLSSVALYGILRFHTLTTMATGTQFSGNLLLGFGLFSVLIALPFIVLARDLKRLFAFSSVEHMGLMAIAFGIGGPLGVTAGLFHLANHAATKAFLFFVAGSIRQRYGTRRIAAIRGMLRVEPVLGWMLVAGVLAITGTPPFGIFVSEFSIVSAGFHGDRWEIAASIVIVLLIGVIFAGFMRHLIGMSYGIAGNNPDRFAGITPAWKSRAGIAAFVPLLIVMVWFGVHVPEPIRDLFNEIAAIIEPASREVAAR